MSATEQDTKVAPTREELIACAVALRPQLVAEQAATEARRFFSPELHQAFLDARFYDLYVPRRYGGLELDVPTFVRIVKEVARGCVSTGWCLGLSMNHALQVGSWWPASAQDAIFARGRLPLRVGRRAGRHGDGGRRRLADRRAGRVRVGLSVRHVLPRAGPCAATRRVPEAARVRRAAQRVGDARRLG